jgi:hypothetical protein
LKAEDLIIHENWKVRLKDVFACPLEHHETVFTLFLVKELCWILLQVQFFGRAGNVDLFVL